MKTHLDSLELRLSHERARLAMAKSQQEKDLRSVLVAQIEREIKLEREFLELVPIADMSDDDLLAELMS
jgi:hypothetical protein